MKYAPLLLIFILLITTGYGIETMTKEQLEAQQQANVAMGNQTTQSLTIAKNEIISEIVGTTNYLDNQINGIRQRFYLLFIGAFLAIQSVFFIIMNASLIKPILEARKITKDLTDKDLLIHNEMIALQQINTYKKFYYMGLLVGLVLMVAGVMI